MQRKPISRLINNSKLEKEFAGSCAEPKKTGCLKYNCEKARVDNKDRQKNHELKILKSNRPNFFEILHERQQNKGKNRSKYNKIKKACQKTIREGWRSKTVTMLWHFEERIFHSISLRNRRVSTWGWFLLSLIKTFLRHHKQKKLDQGLHCQLLGDGTPEHSPERNDWLGQNL